MIERKESMSLLEKWRDKKIIKVVTGVRRCGKSSLLRMFRNKIIESGLITIIYKNTISRILPTSLSSTTMYFTPI